MLGGVCAGLARRCDLDPVIFRVVLVVLSATGGLGLIFYGFAWLLVPYEGEEETEGRRLLTGRVDGPALSAVLCALVGCGLFISMLRNADLLFSAGVLALVTAGAGYWSLRRESVIQDPAAAHAVADAPPETLAPPVRDAPSWWRMPTAAEHDIRVGTSPYLWGPEEVLYQPRPHSGKRRPGFLAGGWKDSSDAWASAWSGTGVQTLEADAEAAPGESGCSGATAGPQRRRPRWIGGWTFLAALLAGAVGAGVHWSDRPLGTSLTVGLSLALLVYGLGMVVSCFLGRLGAGSVLLALLTTGLLIGASVLPKDISAEWVRPDWRPASLAQVAPEYRIGSGEARLDLREVPFGKDTVVRTSARAGAGRLEVLVPEGTEVKLDVDIGFGDIRLPGDAPGDVDLSPGQERKTTLPPSAGAKDSGTLELRMHVGVGQVVVNRAP